MLKKENDQFILSLEDIQKELAEEIKKEIDFHILNGIRVQSGSWSRVEIDPSHDPREVNEWVKENLTGSVEYNNGRVWYLSSKRDTTAFLLWWT